MQEMNSTSMDDAKFGSAADSTDGVAASFANKEIFDDRGQPRVRRSLREIRKPKFDDEIVDSTATMKLGTRRKPHTERLYQSPDTSDSQKDKLDLSSGLAIKLKPQKRPHRPLEQSMPASTDQRAGKKSSIRLSSPTASETSIKRRRERVQSKESHAKDSSNVVSQFEMKNTIAHESSKNWTPADDVALITAVTHICDIFAVYASVRFSRSFSLQEIQERWYQLLYNEATSVASRNRMSKLSPETIANIQSKTVYNVEEEEIIASIPSTTTDDLSNFEQVLKNNRKIFHRARTAQSIQQHWHEMKSWTLLADQNVSKIPSSIDFKEIERSFGYAVATDWQLGFEEARISRELNRADKYVEKLANVEVEPVNDLSDDFETSKGIWGVLKGRVVRYLLRSDCVLLGRNTSHSEVDVDLMAEGPVNQISRKQAVLRVKHNKETETSRVCIINIGRTSLFVDGQTLVTNAEATLKNGSVIVIGTICLHVLLGKDSSVKAEIARGFETPQLTSTA